MKNSNDTIGNRSSDLPVCNAVPIAACPVMNITELHYHTQKETIIQEIFYYVPAFQETFWTVRFALQIPLKSVRHVKV
jgi:hypothetical protein